MKTEKFISKDGFEIQQFDSGEWDIRLIDCKNLNKNVIWNWFKEPDIMIPMLKADCIRQVFGCVELTLICNYLPFSRQDRVFNLGQGIPCQRVVRTLFNQFESIETMCLHNFPIPHEGDERIYNESIILNENKTIVFPDENASKHFTIMDDPSLLTFSKVRSESGIKLELEYERLKNGIEELDNNKTFLICDDICDGGRTFIECSEKLKEHFGHDIKIELLVAHGFLSRGIETLKASGISKIYIANYDSYEYLSNKFNNNDNYIEFFSSELLF